MESQTTVSTLHAYRVKQKVINRTLTVALPEDFEDAEVEVVVLKEAVPAADTSKSDKWEAVRSARGLVSDATIEISEEEWYKQ